MEKNQKQLHETERKLAISFGGSLQLPGKGSTVICDILERAALTDKGIFYIQADGSEKYQSYQNLLL